MVDVYQKQEVLNERQLKNRQLLNHRFLLIWQNIGKSTNQLQLDTCRKMIETWFLDEGHSKKANELFDKMQHRELDLFLIENEIIETKKMMEQLTEKERRAFEALKNIKGTDGVSEGIREVCNSLDVKRFREMIVHLKEVAVKPGNSFELTMPKDIIELIIDL